MRSEHQDRVVKIPLPVGLIREIDEALVAGLGGFSTRTEFFREAAENMLIELKFEDAPDEPVRGETVVAESGQMHETSSTEPGAAGEPFSGLTLTDTILRAPASGWVMETGEAAIEDAPLFGMHNRDYPSLWVADHLARRSQNGPVPLEAFLDDVTASAWEFARQLAPLESQSGHKLTALFPTNAEKPQSAAAGFRAFAIGSVSSDKDHYISAEGALFAWKICQIQRHPGGDLVIGLMEPGWDLLRALDGISLEQPHTPEHTKTFIAHLRQHAPGDWSGFQTALRTIASQPSRTELVDAFLQSRPDWGERVAGTNAQGYIGRAREWGLVEPKQLAGRYQLTQLGSVLIDETSSEGNETGRTAEGTTHD